MMRTLTLMTLVTLSLLALTACNTVHGVGRDLESVGDTIADASKDE